MIGVNRQASRTKNLSHPNCRMREASITRGKSTRALALVHDDVVIGRIPLLDIIEDYERYAGRLVKIRIYEPFPDDAMLSFPGLALA